MDDERRRLSRRTRLRSFALGGLVGTAGTIAARRLSRRPRETPAGLTAFEEAPCFRELVERETHGYRPAGGEIDTGRSTSE